ncbi:MAG: AMP-binding protein [Bacteroidia bacterium]|nr:AMP-binding protein [Bacteroidia bacterium]
MSLLPEIEFSSSEKIKTLQQVKLTAALEYLNLHSVFYRDLFLKNSIDIKKISLENLHQLPLTGKDDLAVRNEDFLCVTKNKIADFTTTSGSTSAPVTFYLTANDLERLGYNEEISLRCAGGTENDIYQLMTTIDKQFMAGLAYYLGVRKLNAGIIRVGPGSAQLQWDSINRFSPTVLIAIPSFIPKLIHFAEEHGIDFSATTVKSIVCIGEPIRNPDFTLNELGKLITSKWNVKLYSTYASTEMGAAFTECEAGAGGHLHPELLILEVINEKGELAKEGELGEVVVTTLGVEGMPLLRYKTGDLCNVYYTKCTCGRNTARLGPVVGRKQQMIKYKGTTLFPSAIFNVLDLVKEIELYQVEVTRDEFSNDIISILLPSDLFSKAFENEIHSLFKSKLRVTPALKFMLKETLREKIFLQDKRKPEKIIFS